MKKYHELLSGGDLRSIGQSNEIVGLIQNQGDLMIAHTGYLAIHKKSIIGLCKTWISAHLVTPAAKVWEALTRLELIKLWFFGVDTATDWKVDSPMVHKGVWQGKPYEDRGIILKIEPPKLLVHSHWSALSDLPDSLGNYQVVSWALSEHDGKTELTTTGVNLPSVTPLHGLVTLPASSSGTKSASPYLSLP